MVGWIVLFFYNKINIILFLSTTTKSIKEVKLCIICKLMSINN